jgi:hypothetical protein
MKLPAQASLALVVLALTLSGCGVSDKDAIASATQAVSKDLRDPDSAKFSDIFVVRHAKDEKDKGEFLSTCGAVNAKNAFGGYVGAVRFVVDQEVKDGKVISSTPKLEDPEDRRTDGLAENQKSEWHLFERIYWNTACVDATHPAL